MVTENNAIVDESDYSEDDLAIFSGGLDLDSSDDDEADKLKSATNNQSVSNKSVSPARKRPSQLMGDVTITLHTLQAHQMFLGRKFTNEKAGITGLLRFGGAMNQIWIASSHNDPYADYILFDIEQILNQASEYINEKSEQMSDLLQHYKERGYNVSLRSSSNPIDQSLRFAPEFTHKAAVVLLNFDYLMRQMLSLQHAAIIHKRESGLISHQARKLLRSAFERSLTFKVTNVTRDDMAANNPVAQKAKSTYNFKVPQQILEGIIRADVSPYISKPRK